MRKKKKGCSKKPISMKKVQKEFNAYIRRRDKVCLVKDDCRCKGELNASHFFPVSGNGALRFYPNNCFGQCAGHHISHHKRNPWMYPSFMMLFHKSELEWMASVRTKKIRYTQDVLGQIITFCQNDMTNELINLIKTLLT